MDAIQQIIIEQRTMILKRELFTNDGKKKDEQKILMVCVKVMISMKFDLNTFDWLLIK